MRRVLFLFGSLLVILSVTFAAISAQRGASISSSSSGPVVLISIDGLKPDYVLEADKHNLKIPNLRRFLKEGSYASNVTGVEPTVTYPSHTTMVTGVAPAKHGIYYNTPFDPFGKNQGGWYWYAEDIKSPTLWEVVNKAGGTTASVDWPVTAGANITYNIAQMWRARNAEDRKLIRAVSTPGLLAEAERAVGDYPEGYDYSVSADKRRAAFNVYILEKKKPKFMTVYFSGLDEEQHAHGPYSAEAFAAIEAIDALVGQVRAAAEKSVDGPAVVAVVSDHGFLPTKKELRLNAALRKAGVIEVDDTGKLKSWRALAWGSGGSAQIMLKDPNDKGARNRVAVALKILADGEGGCLFKFYEGEEARKLGGSPDAAFIVGFKPGCYFGGGLDEPVTRDIKPGGGHGYLPELTEMDSSFFLAGPGIPAGHNLGRIDMRDIAPTLAKLLGVALPTAEGRDVFRRK